MYYGKTLEAIPATALKPWSETVVAAHTGPNTGLTKLDLDSDHSPSPSPTDIGGTRDWDNPSHFACGISASLYEEDRTQTHGESTDRFSVERVGEPVADVFGIIARENSCVMAVADGVSWGKKARLAARCAVRAVMEHVTDNMTRMHTEPNSHTILQLLLDAITKKAHELIMSHQATLTTLSVAVACEIEKDGEWGLFVASVGDSPVYLYCPHEQKVIEATVGCHQLDGDRDMKMAGGSLGPAIGSHPDLANLTVAYMPCYPGDIVLIVSDGISDNFSGKVAAAIGKDRVKTGKTGAPVSVPCSAHKRQLKPCCESVLHLGETIKEHQSDLQHHLSAQTISGKLINHALEVTQCKRELRSSCLAQGVNFRRRVVEDPDFAARVREAPGKLDHATVVAYQVGRHSEDS